MEDILTDFEEYNKHETTFLERLGLCIVIVGNALCVFDWIHTNIHTILYIINEIF